MQSASDHVIPHCTSAVEHYSGLLLNTSLPEDLLAWM